MHIFDFQKLCVPCGKSKLLEVHHRIFRSEGESVLREFLKQFGKSWGILDIQNEVVLCKECHDEIHVKGNRKLREFLRNTYTNPINGINTPFIKTNKLW